MTVRPPAPPRVGPPRPTSAGKAPRAPTRAVGASKVSKPVQQMDAGGAPNVTSVEYWDKVADAWQGEIHNSLREDTGRVIQTALDHFAQGAPLVLDLGCGVGNYLPSIAFRLSNASASTSARSASRSRGAWPRCAGCATSP